MYDVRLIFNFDDTGLSPCHVQLPNVPCASVAILLLLFMLLLHEYSRRLLSETESVPEKVSVR